MTAAMKIWRLSLLLALCILLDAAAGLAAAPTSFTGLAEKAGPSVVNISIESTIKGPSASPFPHGTPFDEFFDQFDPFGKKDPQRRDRSRKLKSLGSGFIISADGFIITNNHVVENADKVMVNVQNVAKQLAAKVIGRDPETDLALLKVDAGRQLPFLALGDSSKAQVGEWVLAIGDPFGLDHTITAGIISAKGRVIGEGPYDDFIQTDASINPGNSGGPLVNMEGEVIGINAAIVASGQGIGFAIPSNVAKDVIAQLKEHGKVTRGLIGVNVQDVDENTAKALGLKETKGALVASVVPGEPGEKAGLQAGDVITEVNGNKVDDSRQLTRIVGGMAPGAKVDLQVFRNGSTKKVQLTLGERNAKSLKGSKENGGGSEPDALGLSMRPMKGEEAKALGLKDAKGLLVVDVDEDGPAAEAGMRRGDVVLEINQKPVSSLAEARAIIEKDGKAKGVVLLLVRRQGQSLFVSIPLQPKE